MKETIEWALRIFVDSVTTNPSENENRFARLGDVILMECEDIFAGNVALKYTVPTFHRFDSE